MISNNNKEVIAIKQEIEDIVTDIHNLQIKRLFKTTYMQTICKHPSVFKNFYTTYCVVCGKRL